MASKTASVRVASSGTDSQQRDPRRRDSHRLDEAVNPVSYLPRRPAGRPLKAVEDGQQDREHDRRRADTRPAPQPRGDEDGPLRPAKRLSDGEGRGPGANRVAAQPRFGDALDGQPRREDAAGQQRGASVDTAVARRTGRVDDGQPDRRRNGLAAVIPTMAATRMEICLCIVCRGEFTRQSGQLQSD